MASAAQWGIDQLADDEIISRVLTGDRELFAALIRRYSRRLYRVARAVLRDSGEAEDVVQDTFVSAIQNLRQFSGRGRFGSWLSRIAVNHALSRIASRRREVSLTENEDDDPSLCLERRLTDRSPGPEERASSAESSEALYKALATLPERHLKVILLRYMDELDTRTVAKMLDISEENVKVRLHRARRNLRSILRTRTHEPGACVSRLGSA
jgi:RNA polymerase sigma-70 factor (ECF subfamily)